MRVIKIHGNNILNTSQTFTGRKRLKRASLKNSPTTGIYNSTQFPTAAPFALNGKSNNTVKSPHPFSEGYFDIDELLSLEIPEDKKQAPPVSFENSHAKFKMDKYQKDAVDAYMEGKSVVVSAPTGTGKTLIAEHVINENLKKGKRTIYLSPLKALSNEKYTEFSKLFGNYDENGNLVDTKNVGLLTGDVTINPDAPVLVMTTEIYRNSLISGDIDADINYQDYDGVIYDEFHYLGDKQRGTVWEEAVMNTPKHMKQLMLSATASNAKDISGWIQSINPDIQTHLVDVPESERHVPLQEFILVKDQDGTLKLEPSKIQKVDIHRLENKINLSERQLQAFEEMKAIIEAKDDEDAITFLKELAGRRNTVNTTKLSDALQQEGVKKDKADGISLTLQNKNSTIYKRELDYDLAPDTKMSRVVKLLDKKEMTPALFYIFSKKGCNKELNKAAKNCPSLLTPEESRKVYDEVQKAKEKGVYLGADFGDEELEALMKGFAVHHAGKLPAYKSLVENLARQGLIKVCFATETLIAGINMPFKTTVFTSLEKFDGDEVDYITPQIFKQGAGRAGRRGKDNVGNVVIMPNDFNDYEQYLSLTKTNDTSIRSKYDISYASLLSDKTLNNTDETLLSSFAAYQNNSKLEQCEEAVKNKLELLELKGYITKGENGLYQRTEKGETAKRVFGVNEILLTELLYDPDYISGFTSRELIALCTSLSDVKDENPSREFKGEESYMQHSMDRIFNLVDEIDSFENYHTIKDEPTKFSTTLVPYVLQFAQSGNSREEALSEWTKIMNELQEKDILTHEGDFLRIINGTKDILKLIHKLSPDEHVQEEASIAMEALNKPPVTDIFNYELKKD